jgi:SAM-dependent methyltransferase
MEPRLAMTEPQPAPLKHGDFTRLAEDYAKYRPGYAPVVLDAVLGMVRPNASAAIDAADVGAGTGIWTRMLARGGCRTVAVEPNDEMRSHGEAANDGLPIVWRSGTAEDTGLASSAFDLVTMASSLHWADFDRATAEFARLLRPNGCFVSLWNPRVTEANPLLQRVERRLEEIVPDMKRVSSGRSEFCDSLTDRLATSGTFNDVLYLESRTVEAQSSERYLGLWRSVNDVRVQAGPKRFAQFMEWLEHELRDHPHVEATYLTRAWVARKRQTT